MLESRKHCFMNFAVLGSSELATAHIQLLKNPQTTADTPYAPLLDPSDPSSTRRGMCEFPQLEFPP